MSLRLIASTLALILAASSAARAQDDYAALVARYRSGEREAAIQALKALPLDVVQKEVARVSGAQAKTLPAAILLHTELALRQDDKTPSPTFHLGIARSLVERLDPAARADFGRRWLLALGMRQHQQFGGAAASEYLDEGLRLSPGDPELLLARGSLEETAADFSPVTLSRDAALGRAEEFYRRALAADPRLVEARLRLGHVLLRLDRLEQASAQLEDVAGHAGDRSVLVLAHLFLGCLREREGKTSEALASFRAAGELDPLDQGALLGLSHALESAGDRDGAKDALERALAAPADHAGAWAAYHLGQGPRRFEPLLEELRKQAGP